MGSFMGSSASPYQLRREDTTTEASSLKQSKKPQQPKKPVKNKKPSLLSTFAPTKAEIERRPIVFFDITINDVPAGTVFFELFNETVPLTAENFRVLSTGKSQPILNQVSVKSQMNPNGVLALEEFHFTLKQTLSRLSVESQ